MKLDANEIFRHALSLPPPLRAYLAEMLIESLDFEDGFSVSDELKSELIKRFHQSDGGKANPISEDEK